MIDDNSKRKLIVKDQNLNKPINKRQKLLKDILYILLASGIYSFSFHYFVSPTKFAPGGLGGVVAMVSHIFSQTETTKAGLNFSPFIIVLFNIPLLIPAYKVLSKQFAIKTFFTTLLMTCFMFILDNFIDPTFSFSLMGVPAIADDAVGVRILATLSSGSLCGLSLALALKANCSTGGADIVGALIQKKNPHTSIPNMIFMVNSVILFVSIFVYGEMLVPVILSVIYILMTSFICDSILKGSKTALKFEVVTDFAEEIAEAIIIQLGHGVTVLPATGMFEHKDRALLICIIKPRQIAKFQAIISRYPGTFAYISQVNEIIGKFRVK